MSVQERLMNYCSIDTQSDEQSQSTPSTMKQFDLARLLEKEMIIMGMENVTLTEQCYLYGEIPSNIKQEVPTVGFIAHLDTAPDFTGARVSPRIIENYDGKDIELNSNCVMKVDDFLQLPSYKGKDLIVTDGTTLLGADDKAGISEIMEACQFLLENPKIPHGKIKVAFTPDEEVGRGADFFDVQGFDCNFAYTLDGGAIHKISDETFNAASATVLIQGFSIHPGSAKDKMINASNVAFEFHSLLPKEARPETTEGHQGFIHLTQIQSETSHAQLQYILRDHDAEKLEKQKELLTLATEALNQRYGKDTVKIEIEDNYQNMKEVLKDQPLAIEIAKKALLSLGITPEMEAIRGGTDGARLTFMGLPCPNLGTGGGNYHGPYEYCCIQEMEAAVKMILNIVDEVRKVETI